VVQFLASFSDGLFGSIVGVIAIISLQMLKPSIQGTERDFQVKPVELAISKAAQSEPAAVLYMLALVALYRFPNKWVTIILIISGAVAGQFLFVG
jgi:hypothetical protein